MPSSDESCVATEIIHLDVKDEVALYLLEARGNLFARGKDLECNSDIGYFLTHGIFPKCVIFLLVTLDGLIPIIGYLHTKLVVPFVVI